MKPHIICDSGAFGAWRMGIHIDLERYIEFCQRYQDQLVAVANLDVIPGVFGKIPSMAEVEESAQKGWANLKYMERHGVNAMPIFHQGESFKWLTRMLEEGYEYIGISPDNGKNVKQKQAWLDQVFTIITDRDGLPYVNTHGYAVTSVDLMYRYPFKSVDSATWIQLGAFGGTMVPRGLNGDYTYRKAPYVVNISSKGNSTMRQGQHFKNFGPATQRHIIDFFEQQGFSYSQVADTFEARSYLCLRVFEGVKRELVNPVFRHRVSDFFLAQYTPKGLTSFQIPQVEVYYALSSASIYSDMLTVEGLANRIYTYQILKDKPEGFFDFYLRNGVCPTDKCWKRYCDAGNIGAEKPLEFIQPDYSRNNRKPETKVRDWKGNRRKA